MSMSMRHAHKHAARARGMRMPQHAAACARIERACSRCVLAPRCALACAQVGEAFEVLSDPSKKRRWDEGESLDEINGNGGGGGGRGGMGGIDPSDIFRMYTQQGGGRGRPRGFGGM